MEGYNGRHDVMWSCTGNNMTHNQFQAVGTVPKSSNQRDPGGSMS